MFFEAHSTTSYISLGSNLGDRAGNLLLAIRGLMEASFEIVKLSAIYETEPVEIEEAENFLNMIVETRSEGITASQMMARMLRIEYLLGRKDKSLKRPRTIDLDLIFFGQNIIDTPFLTVPHPRLHLRNFVLFPMVEVAPKYFHPKLRKTMVNLLDDCPDRSLVTRWHPNGSPELQAMQTG